MAGTQASIRFATQEGRNDGFRQGYAWGIRNGIDSSTNDAAQKAAGAAAMNSRDSSDLIQKLPLAEQAGAGAGISQGSSAGDQEAKARFTKALDSGALPSDQVTSADVARSNPSYRTAYSDPYSQTVGPMSSEQDYLNSSRIDYGNVTFFSNGYDTDLYGNAPQFRPGDFYNRNGQWAGNHNNAIDPRQAFNVFTQRPGFDRRSYESLPQGQVQIIVGYTQPTTPAPIAAPAQPQPGQPQPGQPQPQNPNGPTGRPGGNPGGGQGGGQAGGRDGRPNPGANPANPPVVTAPAPAPAPAPVAAAQPQPIIQTFDLRAIFNQAFNESYNATANFYYTNAYNDMLDDGTNAGYYVGTQVGQRLAFQTGLVNAYNNEFRNRENASFSTQYNQNFASTFAQTYTTYKTTPQIGVDSFAIVGARDDGFIEPGEGIKASFVIKNYGGVDTTLPVSLEGNVSGSQSVQVLAKHLSTTRSQGTITAQIDASFPSQSDANVVLNVGGTKIPLKQYVTRQVVSDSANYTADMPHGNASVMMTLKNVSKVKSYDSVKIVIADSLGRNQTKELGFLEAGQSLPAVVNLSGFDPLEMIDGKVSASIQAYLGSVKVGSASFAISDPNRTKLLEQTFELAAQSSNAALLARVTDRLYTAVFNETPSDDNNFTSTIDGVDKRTGYDGKDSVIASLVAFKASHAQSDASNQAYSALVNQLRPLVNKMAKAALFGKYSNNKKFFENQLNALDSSN